MGINYGKNLTDEDIRIINEISRDCGILFDTARLLYYRKIDTVEKAKNFLNPGKYGFYNPFLLQDMDNAVQRIILAKQKGESVLVFGDYDADGVCATSILYNALCDFGISARKFVPEREDNYGLNLDTVNSFNNQQKIDLLITVDCGISDGEKIEEIKKIGIDVIVTDHHEPPEVLPNCIKINPKIDGQDYPFKELCGAGVAYKLSYALIGDKADKYLDFVALATIADSMDLIDENRHLVSEGLKLFNDRKTLRLPFKYLLGDINKQITSQTIAYTIAPRVNAGGRMGDAATALALFTSKNPNEIFDLAAKLESYNTARQTECEKIYQQAKQKIVDEKSENDNVILVYDHSWRTGFIGIVAAKLVEEYARPVIVFAGCDGYLKGSARSVEGFNIYDAICMAKDLLITFGGHSQAAGVSVTQENYYILREFLNTYAQKEKIKVLPTQALYAEWEVDKPLSIEFAKELDLLEPFGVGNRRPLFATKVQSIQSRSLKEGSPHFTFKTEVIEMLDFNGGKHVSVLSFPVVKNVLFELNLSLYKSKYSLKGYVRNVVAEYDGTETTKPYEFYENIEKIVSGVSVRTLDCLEYLSVKREDFAEMFNCLRYLSGKYFVDAVDFAKRNLPDQNIYQSIFCLMVFIELGIFSVKNGKFVFNEKVKNALTNSKLYSKIYSLKV